MSNEITIEQEIEMLMDTIEVLEEKMRISEVRLSDEQMNALEAAKVKLSELEAAEKKEVERHLAAAKEEGLIPKD